MGGMRRSVFVCDDNTQNHRNATCPSHSPHHAAHVISATLVVTAVTAAVVDAVYDDHMSHNQQHTSATSTVQRHKQVRPEKIVVAVFFSCYPSSLLHRLPRST